MQIRTIVAGVVLAAAAAVTVQALPASAAPPPGVSLVSPNAATTAGGTTVTVTGKHFTSVTAVTFGATAGTKIKVLSETKLTVTSPAHAAGRVDVRVTAAGGTTPIISLDRFTYRLPAIISISPSKGPLTGGSNVTIAGTDLVGVTKVTVGGQSEPFFIDLSTGTLSVGTPAHAAGPVDIQVTARGGTTPITVADQFTYVAPPTIALSPSSGPAGSSTSVVITGTDLDSVSKVEVAGVSEPFFVTLGSPNTLSVSAGPHAPGPVPITITAIGGKGTATFTYR